MAESLIKSASINASGLGSLHPAEHTNPQINPATAREHVDTVIGPYRSPILCNILSLHLL